MQVGFCVEKNIGSILILQQPSIHQVLEKYEIGGRKLYMVFVDLEKAFDCVPREMIWWGLSRKNMIKKEVFAITEMWKPLY